MADDQTTNESRYVLWRVKREDAAAEAKIVRMQGLILVLLLALVAFVEPGAGRPQALLVALGFVVPVFFLRFLLVRRRRMSTNLVHLFIAFDVAFVGASALALGLSYGDDPHWFFSHYGYIGFFILLALRSLRYQRSFVVATGAWSYVVFVLCCLFNELYLGGLTLFDRQQMFASIAFNILDQSLTFGLGILLATTILAISVDKSYKTLVTTVKEVTTAHGLLKIKHQELAKAKLDAEEASRVKSSFLSIMGHEFKTPLNAMMGFSELIRLRAMERFDADYESDARNIQLNGERMLFLIDRMLILSGKEHEKASIVPHPRVIDIVALKSNLEDMARSLQSDHFEFAIEDRSLIKTLTTDMDLLRKICFELMTNAMQFNDGKVFLQVVFEVTSRDDRCYLMMVFKDNGWGIGEGDLAKIFEVFFQVEHYSTRSINGAGVGLSLCKLICDRMEIDIEVRSFPGAGSEFRLFLPLSSWDLEVNDHPIMREPAEQKSA